MKKKNVLICAHGNSLRALVMHIEKISPEEIVKIEIATGEPIFINSRIKNFSELKVLLQNLQFVELV